MHSKRNYKQVEKTEWEKVVVNGTTDKGLISKIYNREKTISLTSGAGKTGWLPVKEWN